MAGQFLGKKPVSATSYASCMARAVPYAANPLGQLIDPGLAFSGAPYVCLECQEPVSFRREHLRRGYKVEAHFAHRPGSECAGESVIHIAAKMRLEEALTLREHPFTLRLPCQRFGCEEVKEIHWEPTAFDTAASEVAFGSYRLDVATLLDGSVVTGFEVFHSHRIGSVKAATLSIPWIELQADVTARTPYIFEPVIDYTLTEGDERRLRSALHVNRAKLPSILNERIHSEKDISRRINGAQHSFGTCHKAI